MIVKYFIDSNGIRNYIWDLGGVRVDFSANPDDVYYKAYLKHKEQGEVMEEEIPMPEPELDIREMIKELDKRLKKLENK